MMKSVVYNFDWNFLFLRLQILPTSLSHLSVPHWLSTLLLMVHGAHLGLSLGDSGELGIRHSKLCELIEYRIQLEILSVCTTYSTCTIVLLMYKYCLKSIQWVDHFLNDWCLLGICLLKCLFNVFKICVQLTFLFYFIICMQKPQCVFSIV